MISRLFIFEFFQGAAIATYFFSAMTLFVHRLPATELPKVFILSSFLLWFFGFVYSQLEHRLRTTQLIYFVLIFNALIVVLFRIFIDLHEGEWFLYIFLASFNILYLLNNLEFWGLVALLFDVRQSKRLFAIVSAWDGPARLTGYAVSGAFVIINGKNDIMTSKDLLIIASLFMLAALIFFIPMARSKEMRNIAPVDHHHYATQTLQHIQASLTGSKLIRNAALVSFFSFCFYLVTNFVLYGYIKKDIDNDKSLDLFFSVFLIVSRGLTLIVKPLFINRLLDKIGLRKSMLISPVTFAILSAVAIVFSFQSTKTGFYLFLIMAVSIDIMRSAIQSPVLLATLQPLPTQQRLRGHTIIKGLMDPFAFLASGILLLSITTTGQDINLSLLSWVLFSIAIAWIFFAFSVDSNYLKMLTAAVQKRILNERDISITDVNSLNFLLNRIEKGNEEEVLAVLNVVASQPVNREKFFLKALHHKSSKIKQQALRYIQLQQCSGCLAELKKMLDEESDLPVLPQLLLTIAELDKNEDLSAYFNHENQDVSNAAVMAWLSQEDQERRRIAEDHVRKLFESGELKDITNALRIVGEQKSKKFSEHVAVLMDHVNEDLQFCAIRAAGKIGNLALIDCLLNAYVNTPDDKPILESLQLAGEAAIPQIRQTIRSRNFNHAKRVNLFTLTGRIGGKDAASLLEHWLQQFPQDGNLLLSILYQLRFKSVEGQALYRRLIWESLTLGADLSYTLHYLQNHSEKYAMIIHAVELELTALKTKCLWLFSFLYDGEKIRRAKSGFDVNTKDSIANAYELIQMTVPKEYASPFIVLFEQDELAYKYDQLKKSYKEPVLSIPYIIKNMLVDEATKFSEWTKACLLYVFRNQPGILKNEFIEPYLVSDNLILKEAALSINNRNKVF